MKNKLVVFGVFLVVVILGAGILFFLYGNTPSNITVTTSTIPLSSGATSPKNATYIINGVSTTLRDGISSAYIVPGSASKIQTRYFGNEVTHDFNGDGRDDVAFILTQDTGGSGTFYYVVVALNTPNGYVGSNAVLLGDRIAPQSTQMGTGNVFIVNYAERAPGESFAVAPHIGKSMWLLLDPKTKQLVEVSKNSSQQSGVIGGGQASTTPMMVDGKRWSWVSTMWSNGVVDAPRAAFRFALTFDKQSITIDTDCNSIGGKYFTNGNRIFFTQLMSTTMVCQNSQEAIFLKAINEIANYRFASNGELIFDLMDGVPGVMIFR